MSCVNSTTQAAQVPGRRGCALGLVVMVKQGVRSGPRKGEARFELQRFTNPRSVCFSNVHGVVVTADVAFVAVVRVDDVAPSELTQLGSNVGSVFPFSNKREHGRRAPPMPRPAILPRQHSRSGAKATLP
jgi:hypothetical protein